MSTFKVFYPKGEMAVFDLCDWELKQRYKWRPYEGYLWTTTYEPKGVRAPTIFHRLKMGFPAGIVDHINRNSLDNRLSNLRIVNKSQNALNSKKRKINPGGSKFKGVTRASWSKTKWRARIRIDGKERMIGLFESELEAARAYDRYVLAHLGPLFLINFPLEDYEHEIPVSSS